MPTIVPLHRDGHPIKTLDDWRKFAGPKGKERHWQDGRSAKELARAWTSFGPEPAAPQVLLDLFSSHPTFRDVTLTEGTPEDRIYFDQLRGEPRNADFTLIGRSSIGTVVISVEAKADESFGGTVASVVAAAIKRRSKRKASNGDKRAQSLVRFLFADDAPHKNAPYQLLTACAGALSLAEKRGAVAALVVVHEFANGKRANGRPATSQRKLEVNARQLDAFLQSLSGDSRASLSPDRIVGPFHTPGSTIPLYVGKVRTDLGCV